MKPIEETDGDGDEDGVSSINQLQLLHILVFFGRNTHKLHLSLPQNVRSSFNSNFRDLHHYVSPSEDFIVAFFDCYEVFWKLFKNCDGPQIYNYQHNFFSKFLRLMKINYQDQ